MYSHYLSLSLAKWKLWNGDESPAPPSSEALHWNSAILSSPPPLPLVVGRWPRATPRILHILVSRFLIPGTKSFKSISFASSLFPNLNLFFRLNLRLRSGAATLNYNEAVDYLYSLGLFGMKLGLENTFKLAALAGNPQNNLRFIHVAGTNGKGSTCAMLESIY